MIAVSVALFLLVGLSLGLLGGGGSILAVPVLVYVAGLDVHQAVTMSLVVVGTTSAVAVVPHARAGRVRWRTALVFGIAGMAGAYLGGRLGAHMPADVLLVAFAAMMLATSVGMLRGRRADTGTVGELRPVPAVALGVAVGVVTGFVGAGGGFLIVPALVLVGGLSMSQAVGTSLVVIAVQSAAGLAGHLSGVRLAWPLAAAVTLTAIAGSLVGSRFNGRISPTRLRRGFGVLVFVMGLAVLAGHLAGVRGLLVVLAVLTLAAAGSGARAVAARRRRPAALSFEPVLLQTLSARSAHRQEPSMYFAQYYLDCLSQASYLIGDQVSGQAVVVDPRRDVAEYLDDAAAHGLTIVGVVNTHFHADFLSGHLELAKATGAWIGYGRLARAEFETRPLSDGERIVLGDVVLEIMETPGHTPESVSVLVYARADDQVAYGVLTGDALFIGDVGRPDLLASIGVTADELGVQLYDSIQRKLMGLDDAVRVFPAHGAGSACGKNLSTARQSTIGEQRALNYACQPMSQEQFVALVTAGQPSAPEYFGYDAILNRKDRVVFDADRELLELDPVAMAAAVTDGAVVLDAREPVEFAAGHLRGAVNVPLDGRFAETVGMVISPQDAVVVMAPEGREAEVAVRLARIGFDKVAGYLTRGEAYLIDHPDQVEIASRLTPHDLAEAMAAVPAATVVDVRGAGEREGGAVPGSIHVPLAELRRRLDEVPADQPVVLYCAGGWRSSVAASLLRLAGRPDVSDLLGGYNAWQATHPVAG